MPLYSIKNFNTDDGAFSAEVSFDPDHEVFRGHFPGQPVVPGVFLIQIIKDITGMINGTPVKLSKAGNIKFLQVADPRINMKIVVKGKSIMAEEGQVKITAGIYAENTVFIKFNGTFLPA